MSWYISIRVTILVIAGGDYVLRKWRQTKQHPSKLGHFRQSAVA